MFCSSGLVVWLDVGMCLMLWKLIIMWFSVWCLMMVLWMWVWKFLNLV